MLEHVDLAQPLERIRVLCPQVEQLLLLVLRLLQARERGGGDEVEPVIDLWGKEGGGVVVSTCMQRELVRIRTLP